MIDLLFSSIIFAQLSVEPVFGWIAWVPLALVMVASLWLTLSSTGLSLRARWLLCLLRFLAMLLLLLGWLRPGLITQRENQSAGAIAVLIDRSQSMSLASDTSDRSRWEIEREVWQAIVAATDLKFGQTQLVPYFYDSNVVNAASDDLPDLKQAFSKPPTGRVTDLGTALTKIGQLQLDPPLRGVILLGDGTQTLIPAPMDPSVVARQMAQLDQPVLMVGIGPRGEKSQVKDVAIEGVPEQFTAFVKKELKVPLVISAQGVQGIPIKIELILRASGKPDQKVGAREVIATKPSEKLPLEFTIVLPDEGEYLLQASALVAAREESQANNQTLSFVTVREGGVRILYLAGQPLPEQKFLRRSLEESQDFATEFQLWPERERQRWPMELGVRLDPFDVLVIDDLAAEALSDSAAREIVARVRRGAGILFMGGYRSFDAGGYGRSPLAALFPFKLTTKAHVWDAPIDRELQILGDMPLSPTRPHPITTLAPEPDNTRLWSTLKPLQGMNRFGELSRNPGVQVLLEGPQREPALVTGEFGTGRVLAFAGDSTWRWYLAGQAKAHRQFWRQAVLWLVRRDALSEGFRLELERRRLQLDETPDLAVEWFGGSEGKPMPEQVDIELFREGVRLQNVNSTATGDNRRQATLLGLDTPGLYRAALTAQGSDGKTYQAETAFIVRDESRELMQPAADWQMMNNIVAANQAAGGQLVLPEEIGVALDWLRQRQQATQVLTVEKRRLGDGTWDAWLVLVLFCGLMSCEWALRKSWQLP